MTNRPIMTTSTMASAAIAPHPMTPSICFTSRRLEADVHERVDELDRARPEQGDEHGGEDAEDQGEQELRGHLLRLLLRPLAALDPELLGLGPEHVGDADAV